MFIGENLGAGESNTTGASPISDLISPSKIHQWWRYIFDSSLKLHALGFFSSILAFSFCWKFAAEIHISTYQVILG